MHIKTLAALTVVTVLVAAPSAFAFGGGGKRGGGSAGGGSISGGSVASIAAVQNGGGGSPVSAPEPLAGLAVGLGLIGARLLRRR